MKTSITVIPEIDVEMEEVRPGDIVKVTVVAKVTSVTHSVMGQSFKRSDHVLLHQSIEMGGEQLRGIEVRTPFMAAEVVKE
jgi:hypothetical protein